MSQTFDPENSGQADQSKGGQGSAAGHGQGYPYGYPAPQGYPAAPGAAGWAGGAGGPGGSWYAGGPGYGSVPPMPPRRSHKRGLIATGAVALAAGAALGGLIGSMDHTVAGTVTATSRTALTSTEIAARVDPALVDVVSTDGLKGATAEGTGIVLTSTGEVLTNNHVIEGATSIKAIDIGNGKTYTATVVGYDASHDVAVIQLKDASGLTTASLGDSATVQTGDSVTALGNAEGKEGTPAVATGTVTALNQSITASDELSNVSEQLTGLIESNVPIQPGDSGGPLVNSYGQVIGMDTAGSSNYQFQGQSSAATQAYTIPINDALSIAKQIESGTTSADVHIGATAFLGLEIGGSNSNVGGFGGFGGQNGQTTTSGVSIAGTVSGSPAADAGLTAGDTITAIAGQSVSSAKDVAHTLVKYHPGDSISVSWTDTSGQSHSANLTLTTGPAA